MRFRVVLTWHDDGCFGYTAPDWNEVVKDWLTRAEAKAIYRHLCKKYNNVNNEYEWCTVSVDVMTEDGWYNISDGWGYTAQAEIEDWFDRKNIDYNWYIMFDEIRPLRR